MPSVAAGILFIVILALNGLWPFGLATIDHYDMAQQAEAFYFHNYDELRGMKSFFYDWYTCAGRVIPGLSEPSLFDLLFYLVPRNAMLQSMSVLMLIKIMAAAFTMNLFVRYINRDLPYVFRLMLSAGYGLCGFIIVNYTIPQWLDMAVIVPLVLMFSQISLKTGKISGLSVSVFLIMLIDYYFGIQMLTFVFLTGGAFILVLRFGKNKEEIKQLYVLRFALGIIIGTGLSAFSAIPDIAYNLTSARFSNGSETGGLFQTYLSVLTQTTPAYLSRWFSLLGLAFPTALIAKGLFRAAKRRDTADIVFRLLCIFMVTAQLVAENVHLILHFFSYVNYPVRNGFMIYCIFCAIAAVSYEKDDKETLKGIGKVSGLICVAVTLAVIMVFRFWYRAHEGLSDHTVLLITMGFMTVAALIHLILNTADKGRYGSYGFYLWVLEISIAGMIMIGPPLYDSGYGNEPEQEGEYIRITDQLVDGFEGKLATGADAATLRIKNPDTSLNANYGLVMRRETLSGWSSFATEDQISGAISLGYSSQFTRLLDSGGNVFTDAMLHVVNAVSHTELDNSLYEKTATVTVATDHMTGEKLDYSLYENRYTLPFAIPLVHEPAIKDSESDIVKLMNSYAMAMGAGKDIAAYIDTEPVVTKTGTHVISEYALNVTGRKTLYFTGNCTDTDYYNTRITVNGCTVKIPSIGENDNEMFPAHFNNNTVELGSFDDEQVSLVIDMDTKDASYFWHIYSIDRDVLSDICDNMPSDICVIQKRSGLDITLDNDGGYSGILIPVSYDIGWSARVNATAVEPENINGLFMYVAIPEGHDVIKLSYFPPFMKPGIVTALVCLVCFAAISIIDKKKKPVICFADRVMTGLYLAAFTAAFVFTSS